MIAKNQYKIGILSLGCPRNLVDSESILGRLSLKGHPIVDMQEADIGIVNTCAFIEDARLESIDAILDLIQLKKEGRLKKVIVYGCLAQRYKDSLLEELPEVDAFVGKVSLNHGLKSFAITPKHYRYLKICEGCLNYCSYCIIPKIKGRFASLDMDSILKRVEKFDQERISELNIIGQDISGYGLDLYGIRKLPELLKTIVKKTKYIRWIRLLYLYPDLSVIDELLDIIKNEPKICRYIDLPIQHINQRILKLMNRNTAKRDIIRIIERIRRKLPEVAIRTSLIVGFPSETDREFKELFEFIQEIKFERLGAFIYSREEGTKAFGLKPQLPKRIKEERLNAVMSSQQIISREINKKFLDKTIDVLIDEKDAQPVSAKNVYLGRTQYDTPEVDGLVYVSSKKELNPGNFVRVKVDDTLEYDLVGEAI